MHSKKLIIPLTVFLLVMIIASCEGSSKQNDVNSGNTDKVTNENNSDDSNKGYTNAEKQKEAVSNLNETEIKFNKDMENIIEKPEYNSFEGYVSSSADDFNGESEMWDVYADEDDLKKHLVITSGEYLRHFTALGEIPEELQELVNDGIHLSAQIDWFESNDINEIDEKYNQLKDIYNKLEGKIQKKY